MGIYALYQFTLGKVRSPNELPEAVANNRQRFGSVREGPNRTVYNL